MSFMILVKADPASEAGALPTEKDLAAMSAFNQELARAGVLLSGEGLRPSSQGEALQFSDGKRIQRVKGAPFE